MEHLDQAQMEKPEWMASGMTKTTASPMQIIRKPIPPPRPKPVRGVQASLQPEERKSYKK